jgi:two-component system phosphate regulon sensor histidine kinase PhoR
VPILYVAAAILAIGLGLCAWRLWTTRSHLQTTLQDNQQLRAELLAAQDALRRSEPMHGLSEVAFDALILVGERRQVVSLNQPARKLFDSGSGVGESLIALTRSHEVDELARRALADAEDLDRQIVLGERPYRVRALCIRTDLSAYVALALQDITELKRLGRARRDMVANITHELRTPITSIRLLVDTLARGALRDKQQAPTLLDKIAAETDALHQMSQELLDLSMIESGQALFRMIPCSLTDLVDQALDHLNEQAERRELSVEIKVAPDIRVLADPDQAQRVLRNLLHNAIKFTPPGGRMRVTAEQNGEWVTVSVLDTGPGIPPDERERVFERFYRGDRARGSPGTGLGLAIAKHIVEAHGGRIWVADPPEPGGGAHLRFTLPTADT